MPDGLIPDVALVNGDIHTLDPTVPRVSALAIAKGRIVKLGADSDILCLTNSKSRIIDAKGKVVLPGFQDTHIHLQDSGFRLVNNFVLNGTHSVESLQMKLKDFAGKKQNQTWITGGGWLTADFGEHNLNKQVLDNAVSDRPVFLFDSNFHCAIVNSKACEILGLNSSTPDPLHGRFVRDKSGSPTGMLYEQGIKWAQAKMPQPKDEEYFQGTLAAQDLCNRNGITSVLDPSVTERHLRVYQKLENSSQLSIRISAGAVVEPHESAEAAFQRVEALRRAYYSPALKLHSAKFFLDGMLENRTASMLEDYLDSIGGNAPLMFEPQKLRELFVRFDAARFQIHIHVIGDRALRAGLDALQAAREVNGSWESFHQFAHIECLHPKDLHRFKALGAVANVQPLWACNEFSITDVAIPMLGSKRSRWIYAFKSLLDAGTHMVLSSDWNVSTLNPFQIIQTALTRQPCADRRSPVFIPAERIDLLSCIRGYTVNAATAAWQIQDSGTLSFGKWADLVILDRNIFQVDPYEIGDTQVLLTLLGGREVYRAPNWS